MYISVLTTINIVHCLKVIGIAALSPSDSSTLKNIRANKFYTEINVIQTIATNGQNSLTMLIMSTLTCSFKTSLRSLWKLLCGPQAGCPRSSAAFPGVRRSCSALDDVYCDSLQRCMLPAMV